MVAVDDATDGSALRQLQHDDDVAVAAQQPGRNGVQRLRTLLQTARRQPAAGHEEGRHPDAQAQAQGRDAAQTDAERQQRGQRGRSRRRRSRDGDVIAAAQPPAGTVHVIGGSQSLRGCQYYEGLPAGAGAGAGPREPAHNRYHHQQQRPSSSSR